MLEVDSLETGYGKKQVLFGATLTVHEREIVALIGPNGAGKSTVLKAICGLVPTWKGAICFGGTAINGSTPAENVTRGITFAPQGNRVFHGLTVLENLEAGGFHLANNDLKGRVEEIFALFPVLERRARQLASKLSGGEQQMLAVARALIPRPKLLMLDEPSLGLAPNLVAAVLDRVCEINQNTGIAVLIVEQKVRESLRIAHRAYGLRLCTVVLEGSPSVVSSPENLHQLFLG